MTSPDGDRASLHDAVMRRIHRRAITSGSITVPAVPELLDEYVAMCHATFSAIGVDFSESQLAQLRTVIEGQLAEAFAASHRSDIVITYDCPVGLVVNYHVRAVWSSLESAYDSWVATREPPYFGTEPDARVTALSSQVADPATCPVLDVGAGTGRNALSLAQRGHPVDAVEPAPAFAQALREAAATESLSLRVIESEFSAGTDQLRHDYGLIVVSEVTSDFRSTGQLCDLFETAAAHLTPGGLLALTIFVPRGDYVPDAAARQLGEQTHTSIFTRTEIAAATSGLPFELISDDAVYEYEKDNLPAEAWPPTSWYEGWVSGQDVFDIAREDSPIEMRWLVYRTKW